MRKFDCLTSENNTKYFLLRDYGDSTKYTVLCTGTTDVFVKTDGRIKSVEDFIRLYGYKSIHSQESLNLVT